MDIEDVEAALDWVDKLVFDKTGNHLNTNYRVVFKGSWNKDQFKEMPIKYNLPNCSYQHLMKNVSRKFFKMIANVLNEKKVNKDNFKAIVQLKWREWWKKQQEALPQIEQDEGKTPLQNPPDTRPPSDQGDEAGSEGGAIPETSSTNHEYTHNTIALIIQNPSNITRENLPRETRVKSLKPGSLQLFKRIDAPFGGNNNWCLEDLLQDLPQEENGRWVQEFLEFVYLLSQGVQLLEVKSTFQALEGKLFKAIFQGIDKSRGGSLVWFIFIFKEHFSKGYIENAPSPALATLATAFNLGLRLEWEVIDKFMPMLDNLSRQDLEAINRVLREVKNSFLYIEDDAEHRRKGEAPRDMSNKDRLRDSFESEHEKRTIKDNLSEQEKYKNILRNADRYDNIDEVRDALTQLKCLNKIVMDMVINRFRELYGYDSP